MTHRRRYLDRAKPRDTREIVTSVRGRVLSCDEYAKAAQSRMEIFDALPADYRAVVNEFNIRLDQVALMRSYGLSADAMRQAAQAAIVSRSQITGQPMTRPPSA